MTATAGCTTAQYNSLVTKLGDNDLALAVCTSLQNMNTPTDTSAMDALKFGVNSGWLITSGALVFIMHAGFAMLCAGAIRRKNAMNILLQTMLDACCSAIAFYLVGFGFAYGEGDKPNAFIGNALFGLDRYSSSFTGVADGRWTDFFYQWAFAATAATIPAGCVAERLNFNAYLGYSSFISAWVYPVVTHWVWCRQGWLTYNLPGPTGRTSFLFDSGMIDFAGSAVVHMVGGLAGMMGCILVGPRLGRFNVNGVPTDMPGHSTVLVVLGTMLLWFGWYGFNPGSSLIIDNVSSATVASRAAVMTTLSGSAGGIASLVITKIRHRYWDLLSVCNGTLVGFVAVTAGAHVLEPWAAIACGIIGACVFELVAYLFLYKLKIDDPLSAAPMHAFGGATGVLFVGFLAKKEYIQEAYGRSDNYGLFYGGGGRLLACQLVGVAVIAGWTCVNMGIFFYIFKMFNSLRIPYHEEEQGLDVSKHGRSVYGSDHDDPNVNSVHRPFGLVSETARRIEVTVGPGVDKDLESGHPAVPPDPFWAEKRENSRAAMEGQEGSGHEKKIRFGQVSPAPQEGIKSPEPAATQMVEIEDFRSSAIQ